MRSALLLERWMSVRSRCVRAAAAAMTVLGAAKLADELRRLLFEQSGNGAVDLLTLDLIVRAWRAGWPVYQEFLPAIMPPASYVLLTPLAGWLGPGELRWFWALTTAVAVAAALRLVVRDGGLGGPHAWLACLLLLSMNATGVVIGNGQIILHLLPALVAAVLWLHAHAPSLRRDVLVAACFVFALIKPSVSAPFFWLVLFAAGGLRPALLTAIGYAGVTLFAAALAPYGLADLLRQWVANTAMETGGYAEVNSVMHTLGIASLAPAVSLALLAAWGLWIAGHRAADRWILLGATGLFARFWTYHRVYDDVLVFLAEIALLRISVGIGHRDENDRRLADLLLFVTAVAMLCPARMFVLAGPVGTLFRAGHAVVWGAVLAFLMTHASQSATPGPLHERRI